MTVTVDEILILVNLALGNASPLDCAAGDADHDGRITVDEILTAVYNALHGCAAPQRGASASFHARQRTRGPIAPPSLT